MSYQTYQALKERINYDVERELEEIRNNQQIRQERGAGPGYDDNPADEESDDVEPDEREFLN